MRLFEMHNDINSLAFLKSQADSIAKIAQKVYDDWDEENTDQYAGGGICHYIADDVAYFLGDLGIECCSMSSDHEQHVFVVAKCNEGVFMVDIPYHVYERGGGYTWYKIPDVTISAQDVVFYQISPDPDFFEEYTDQ